MSRTEWQYTKLRRRLLELSYRAERCEARGYAFYIDIQLYHQLWANCCKQVRLLQTVCALLALGSPGSSRCCPYSC
eukprot:1001289-Pyramimonas_sp.AAC.1